MMKQKRLERFIIEFSASVFISLSLSCQQDRCEVTGGASRMNEQHVRAVCSQVSSRFAELFGVSPPPGRIVLNGTISVFNIDSEKSAWALVWPTAERMDQIGHALGMTAGYVDSLSSVLMPHEMGHVMLIAYLYPDDSSYVTGEYGTSLPDWMDEGLAVWMEPDWSRVQRLQNLQASSATLPKLDDLLTFEFQPEVSPGFHLTKSRMRTSVCNYGVCPGPKVERSYESVTYSIDSTGHVSVDTVRSQISGESLEELTSLNQDYLLRSDFWSVSYAFFEFLYQTSGRAAVRRLFNTSEHGVSDGDLVQRLGLHGNLDSLDQRWREWLEQQRFP